MGTPPTPVPPAPAPPAPPDPNAAAKAETDRLNAETALEKARAERVKALGLPNFADKATLNQGAGAIEALILATEAIEAAARDIAEIAERVHRPNHVFVILAGDEQLDFGIAAAIRAEIEAFASIFDTFQPQADDRARALAAGLAGPIAAISTIAGLLRTETQITAVDHAAISHRVLATAVAGRLPGKAILPGAAIGPLPARGPLILDLMKLARRRDALSAAIRSLPADESEVLKAGIARFDGFFVRVTSPDAAGRVTVAQAARLEQLLSEALLVLRIFVEKAGGSLINRTNLLTFLAIRDPVRVSGGLVASFTITDPATGRVLAAKVLNCRTRLASLKQIQSGAPTSRAENGNAVAKRDGRHADRIDARSMQFATRRNVMPTHAERAEMAIENYLQEHRPEELQLVWRERKPSSDWDMEKTAWRGVGARIVVNFNELDPNGVQLDPDAVETDNAIRNLHDAPLVEFEQYLIDEADAALG